ncbi:glycogen synthase GlgA [Enterococcus sp. LJL98]
MKLLFTAFECAPFFKTGGLGDVAGALPKALAKKGIETLVVLPYFTKMADHYKRQCEDVLSFTVSVGWRQQYCGVKRLEQEGVTYYFLDNLYYFDRENLYGDYDDGERFAFFQQAVIEMMEKIAFIPDIIHVNDYHTAMIPFLLKEKYHWIQAFQSIRTVLTIHNIEFQGQYGPEVLSDLFGMGQERFDDGTLRWHGALNFLKTGILYANHVNAVSPSYAEEIKTTAFGNGLEGVLQMESGKLSGILNGIDYERNDPLNDPALVAAYSIDDLTGKAENKKELQRLMGLSQQSDVPVISVVSRLTYQKGFHLLLEELENLLQFNIQFVLLGTGDPNFEAGFAYLSQKYPEKCAVSIDFDVQLAQKIYAGSDLFLMPSAFEPCGLSQMIAMRYGTLPVVHEIGGLRDTVEPFNPVTGEGTGFGFVEFTGFQLMQTIKQAIQLYEASPDTWRKVQRRAMAKDFSWTTACQAYLDLYAQL